MARIVFVIKEYKTYEIRDGEVWAEYPGVSIWKVFKGADILQFALDKQEMEEKFLFKGGT